VRGMDELLPAGARGLMLTGMLAALASTLDTHLNWGASYWSNDLYKGVWIEGIRRRMAGSRQLVRVARLSTFIILAIALTIMGNLDSIQTAWHISLLFGAGTGAVLVLRWLWERVNLWCEIAAIVTSLILAPILLLTVDAEWLRLGTMSAASVVVVVATAFLAPQTRSDTLVAFYRTVRPPGWWRKTALAAGEDPLAGAAELRRDIAGLISCAISVYTWLVGIGMLLLGHDNTWLAILLVGAGLAVVPVWVRTLMRTRNEE